MEIRCEGGLLDGHTVRTDEPERTIHQNGLWLLRVHQAYPKRKGEKVTKRLVAFTEAYNLTTEATGPVYRCVAPVAGPAVGGALLVPTEGGGFDVWVDRDGNVSACPPALVAGR